MKKNILFTSVFCAAVLLSGCASYHLRQGNNLYERMAYNSAAVEYQKALGKKMFPEAQIGLAESYRKVNNQNKALEAFAKAVELKEIKPVNKLHYARLLMSAGDYSSAKKWFREYLKDVGGDKVAAELLASCDKIDALKKDSLKYLVELSPLNSGQNNYSPVYYKDGIVFATDRTADLSKKKTSEWTGLPYLDLFFARQDVSGNLDLPVALAGDVNGIYHDGPASFYGDTVMYFTRNNYLGKKEKLNNDETVNLKIFESTNKNNSWTDLREFPFSSDNYSTSHPALSADGNTMYFVSNMEGGQGGTDIWMCKKENNSWSSPVNMGPKINTSYNELFPYISDENVLYFSSEGHTNMGGLDIFYSENKNGDWSDAANIGYPINSGYDDFGITMKDTAGFFSSNRANPMQDNIYSFVKNELRFSLSGMAIEKVSLAPVAGVKVELENKSNGKKISVITGDDGKFYLWLPANSDFKITGSKELYFIASETISTKGLTKSADLSKSLNLVLELQKVIVNKPIVLESIYYDVDKWDIRLDAESGLLKLALIMFDNPNLKIELSAFTDSRAEDEYNLVLSEKRAQAAVNYLVEQGIDKSRLVAKGYGETRLVNACKNGVACTEAEHQQNRRTEFKVIGIEKKDNQ